MSVEQGAFYLGVAIAAINGLGAWWNNRRYSALDRSISERLTAIETKLSAWENPPPFVRLHRSGR